MPGSTVVMMQRLYGLATRNSTSPMRDPLPAVLPKGAVPPLPGWCETGSSGGKASDPQAEILNPG